MKRLPAKLLSFRTTAIALGTLGYVACMNPAAIAAEPSRERSDQGAAASPGGVGRFVEELPARLNGLSPTEPEGYLRLGEEVLSEAATPEHKALAIRLLVLAVETARYVSGAEATARSACLALATAARSSGERRWLVMLADIAGPPGAERSAREPRSSRSVADSARHGRSTRTEQPITDGDRAAAALALVRAGEGRRALRLLDRPGAASMLLRYERLLSPSELPGGAARVRRLAEQTPICTGCANRRWQRASGEIRLCTACRGVPGPALSDAEWAAWLRTELSLVSTRDERWSVTVVMDGGEVLRDAQLTELAAAFGVDATKPVYRSGAWTTIAGWPPAQPALAAPTPSASAEAGAKAQAEPEGNNRSDAPAP
jgi:hypothetical protein